jgi:ABC-type Fe3+ transport system substrate-binding protein
MPFKVWSRFSGATAALLVILTFFAVRTDAFGGSAVTSARKDDEGVDGNGFVFATRRDEVIAKAKREGSLRGLLGLEREAIKHIKEGFGKKYPFIRTNFEEITGTDAAQRFLLELKAGRVSEWDIAHISPDFHVEYLPYLERLDLVGMAEQGVLQIPSQMLSAKRRNIIAAGSVVDVAVYGKNLLSLGQAPKTWDDFLKPEYKGKKVALDARPLALATLFPALGKDWVLNFARKLAAQDPIWVRTHPRTLTALEAGEFPLFLGTYYHTVMNLRAKGMQNLAVVSLEPVPVRLLSVYGLVKGSSSPHAAMLFFEYLSGPEAQNILDEIEPLKSSIYSPHSKLQQLVRGKKVSVMDWEHIDKMGSYMKDISEAYGFPTVTK